MWTARGKVEVAMWIEENYFQQEGTYNFLVQLPHQLRDDQVKPC